MRRAPDAEENGHRFVIRTLLIIIHGYQEMSPPFVLHFPPTFAMRI